MYVYGTRLAHNSGQSKYRPGGPAGALAVSSLAARLTQVCPVATSKRTIHVQHICIAIAFCFDWYLPSIWILIGTSWTVYILYVLEPQRANLGKLGDKNHYRREGNTCKRPLQFCT